MAITVNENESKPKSNKYHGITTFNVVCVNPTKDEMNEMGIKTDKDPSYLNTERGNTRIDIYLENTTVKTKATFFLSVGKESTKNPGSFQWVDKFGNFQWGTEPSKIGPSRTVNVGGKDITFIFDQESARKAYAGEEALTNFIRAIGCVEKDQECRLDTIESIFTKGDISEIASIINSVKSTNSVWAAVGITGNGYYNIYNKKFLPGFVKSVVSIANAIQKDSYAKENYGVYPYNFVQEGSEQPKVSSETSPF